MHYHAFSAVLCGLCAVKFWQIASVFYMLEFRLCKLQGLFFAYVTADHQDRIFWLIVCRVKFSDILDAPVFDIFYKTYRRPVVGMIDESVVEEAKIQISHRVIVCPPSALLVYDLALRLKFFVFEA